MLVMDTETERKLITHTNPKSPIAEAFRTLRTNLHFSALDRPYKTIMYTSTGPGEGKSTLLANTAVAMAQAGNKILIIDCDLRKPVQHKVFGLPNIQGITNVLVEGLDPFNVIQCTDVENVDVLTSGPIPPNPAELLASKKMDVLIEILQQKYEMLLFDAPPVIAVTDAALLTAKVDGTILVIRASKTKIDIAKDAKEQLEKANGKIIGTVLNGIEHQGDDYQYYYYYGHNKQKSKKSIFNIKLKWGTTK